MSHPMKGRARTRCDVCARQYYYVNRAAFPLRWRVRTLHKDAPAFPDVELEAGALICDRCLDHNREHRNKCNPLKPPAADERGKTKPRSQLCIRGTSPKSVEATFARSIARDSRALAQTIEAQGRMGGTVERLRCIAAELDVIAGAIEHEPRELAGKVAANG